MPAGGAIGWGAAASGTPSDGTAWDTGEWKIASLLTREQEEFCRHAVRVFYMKRAARCTAWAALRGAADMDEVPVWFHHRVSQGYHFTIAIWDIKGR